MSKTAAKGHSKADVRADAGMRKQEIIYTVGL